MYARIIVERRVACVGVKIAILSRMAKDWYVARWFRAHRRRSRMVEWMVVR